MIISASRRTDIPAFYSSWLLKRLEAGTALIPHPRNPGRIGSIRLDPGHVDILVLWTKNALPMLGRLAKLDDLGYRYYFTHTITPYGSDIEAGLPPKKEIVDGFLRLSDHLGPKGVDLRYDPVIFSEKYPLERHLELFGRLCDRLKGSTERCILNFIKPYRHIGPEFGALSQVQTQTAAAAFAKVAREYQMPLYNCTELCDLTPFGIQSAACIDREKIESILGYPIKGKKDPGQPKHCRCLESVDIGVYDSCANGCKYCYAVTNHERARTRMESHDENSPMLIGNIKGTEIITDRTKPSNRTGQTSFFQPDEPHHP